MKKKPRWFCCDICGMRYGEDEVRWSSYETARCPSCNDGIYDLKNHPQNYVAVPLLIDPESVEHPRPDESFDA